MCNKGREKTIQKKTNNSSDTYDKCQFLKNRFVGLKEKNISRTESAYLLYL